MPYRKRQQDTFQGYTPMQRDYRPSGRQNITTMRYQFRTIPHLATIWNVYRRHKYLILSEWRAEPVKMWRFRATKKARTHGHAVGLKCRKGRTHGLAREAAAIPATASPCVFAV